MSPTAPARTARLPVWKRCLYASVVLLLFVSIPEAICRWTDLEEWLLPQAFANPYEASPSRFWKLLTYDPVTFWRGRPYAPLPGTTERLTARGLRGPDFPDTKPPGTTRIVCMGDSATFGLVDHGNDIVRFDPTYAATLQRLLTGNGAGSVEVINAGVLGHTTLNGLRQLKHVVRKWRPDIITVRYGVNDYLQYLPFYRLAYEPRSPAVRWVQDLFHEQQWFQLLTRLRDVPRVPAPEAAMATAAAAPQPHGPQVPPIEFDFNLRRLVVEGRAAGARVVLLTAPLAPLPPTPEVVDNQLRLSGYPSYEALAVQHERYADIVRTVAADLQVPLLDSIRLMSSRGLEEFFTGYDLFHPNGDGHIVIAEDLSALLRAEGMAH